MSNLDFLNEDAKLEFIRCCVFVFLSHKNHYQLGYHLFALEAAGVRPCPCTTETPETGDQLGNHHHPVQQPGWLAGCFSLRLFQPAAVSADLFIYRSIDLYSYLPIDRSI